MRTCAGCGIDFLPAVKGGRARYHSEACRKAASRRRDAGHPALVPVPAPTETAAGMGRLEAATLRDLELWKKADTVVGVIALLLARRIDSGVDSGSGLAVLAKALTGYWKELHSTADTEDNPLTRLRRQRHLATAADLPDEPWNPDEDPA
jgi:hypothetical protein